MAANELVIESLDPARGADEELIGRLAALVNDVYATAEDGIWREDMTRTTPEELADLIAAGETLIARTAANGVVGTVRVHEIDPHTGEFGMLAVAPDQRSLGIGRALVDEAERVARERGWTAMRLELLVPCEWRHPSKEFLTAWYERRGYRRIATSNLEAAYPHLAPLVITRCELQIHLKHL